MRNRFLLKLEESAQGSVLVGCLKRLIPLGVCQLIIVFSHEANNTKTYTEVSVVREELRGSKCGIASKLAHLILGSGYGGNVDGVEGDLEAAEDGLNRLLLLLGLPR